MDAPAAASVLVLAYKTSASPALLDAIRRRAEQGPAYFHLLLPNPAHAGWRPSEIQHPNLTEGEQMLALALPLVQEAAGGHADGVVSRRHDPMDAVEEALASGHYDEIIVSVLPHHASTWMHFDLPHRLGFLGLPVTTVTPKPSPRAT